MNQARAISYRTERRGVLVRIVSISALVGVVFFLGSLGSSTELSPPGSGHDRVVTAHRRLETYPVVVAPDDGGREEGELHWDDYRDGCEIGCSFANVVEEDGKDCPKHGQLLFDMNYDNVPPILDEICLEPCQICHHDPCEAEVLLAGEWFSCCAMYHTCTEEQELQLSKLVDDTDGDEDDSFNGTALWLILILCVMGILGCASIVLMKGCKPKSIETTPSQGHAASPSIVNVAEERHMVVFTRSPTSRACDNRWEPPPFDTWFASRGVREQDFDDLMKSVFEPVNTLNSHLCGYVVITIASCGACGWCCQLAEAGQVPRTIQIALDSFHAKYPHITGSISQAPPGLVFVGQQPSPLPPSVTGTPVADAVVPEVVEAATVVVAAAVKDDPTERLRQLKSMLDGGLITQQDYDEKKAQILEALCSWGGGIDSETRQDTIEKVKKKKKSKKDKKRKAKTKSSERETI